MNPSIEFTAVFIKRDQGDGYMAYLRELPEVASEGDTVDDAARKLFDLLPDVWKVKAELAEEERIINGRDDESFTTQKFSFAKI